MTPATAASRDVAETRRDFPILERTVHGRRLVYLDSAATSQKPKTVLASLTEFYGTHNANIHRGIHTLAEEATALYEAARERVAKFVGAPDPHGIVFTRNTTEAINLVRIAWARRTLKPGDEIISTAMEHHSNFVPWLQAARETGATLRIVEFAPDGRLDLAAYRDLLGPRTKLVAVTQVSNVLGTINPVAQIAADAKRVGALVLVDGAQSVPHMPVRFPELGADFLAFSAHKMLGPTGLGVLVADRARLEGMDPFLGGGSMIREVRDDRFTANDVPWKFEAGTPNIADAVAFASALDYLDGLGMEAVRAHEVELTRYALGRLAELPSITVHGPKDAAARGGVVSFTDAAIHPHDLATVLDREGVAIRAGHHCAQPLMRRLGVVATARASFYVYNDRDDVDALMAGLAAARKYFGPA